ncbi:MAG: M56 family metallopeptidase, partial [Thermoguttaceae bacterium]
MSRLATIVPPAEAVSYLVNWAVAVSLVCIVGLLAVRLCRCRSAPLRHGILLCTLTLTLLSPAAVWLAQRNGLAIVRLDLSDRSDVPTAALATGTVPRLPDPAASPSASGFTPGDIPPFGLPHGRMEMPPESAFSDRPNDASAAKSPLPTTVPKASSPVTGESSPPLPEKSPGLAWWQAVGALATWLWTIGASAALLRLGWGCLALARFCRRLTPLSDPALETVARQAAHAVGLRKPPPLFLSRWAGVPMSIGLTRPAIVLPEAMVIRGAGWQPVPRPDAGPLQAVLLHEMAHIARCDHWVGLGQRLAAVLFWWNPLVYRLGYELAELREEICDNYVMSVYGGGQRLARILVELAERAVIRPPLPSTIGMLETRRTGLAGRITRLLNGERNMETRMDLRSKVFVCIVGLAILTGMASVGGLRLARARSEAAGPDAPAAAEKERTAPRDTSPVDQLATEFPAPADAAQSPQPPADLWKSVIERLSHRLEFHGRVVDPDGKPFPGARIYLLRNLFETHYASPAGILPTNVRAVSGADGGFAFTMEGNEIVVPPRYPCFIVAIADGFGPGLQLAWAVERTGILTSFAEDISGPISDDRKGKSVVRLVKDDVPLTGRVVDAKGQPVAGANIRVLGISVANNEDLTPWLNAVEKEHADYAMQSAYHEVRFLAHRFPQAMVARTGSDGRFRLTGIGRERIGELLIAGPGIESIIVFARTRPGKTFVIPDDLVKAENARNWCFYGADFEHVGRPSIPIVGTVRDTDTGKPLAGVAIFQELYGWETVLAVEHFVCATTDAQGRYRLTGLPAAKKRWVAAAPPLDQPYLCASKAVDIPANADSCNADFQLKRGIWIRGKVTDATTGRALQAEVGYYVFRDNPYSKTAPDFKESSPLNDGYWTDKNGSYALPGLPGRGIVGVSVDGYEHYCYASRVGAESIPGSHVSGLWGGATGMMVYDTYP